MARTSPPQLSITEALTRLNESSAYPVGQMLEGVNRGSSRYESYCAECCLPLRPDPPPERLYIFLHALRYSTESLGAFEAPMPDWAAEGWSWNRSPR
jgi:tRNA pseudouridine32 synthase